MSNSECSPGSFSTIDITAPGRMEVIGDLLDDQALVGVKVRLHALAVHARGLRHEQVDQQGDDDRRHDGFQNFSHRPATLRRTSFSGARGQAGPELSNPTCRSPTISRHGRVAIPPTRPQRRGPRLTPRPRSPPTITATTRSRRDHRRRRPRSPPPRSPPPRGRRRSDGTRSRSRASSAVQPSSTACRDSLILPCVVDVDDHDHDLVADLDHVLHAGHAIVGQLRDVHQAVLAGQDLDEGAEVGGAHDLAGVDLADLRRLRSGRG